MTVQFTNRTEAGCLLASQLKEYANRPDVIVLGLPRGGVPVAYEISRSLCVPLDVCLVRKLGVPAHKELAMGAIGQGNAITVNQDIIESWQVSQSAFEEVLAAEKQELQRRYHLYVGKRLPVSLKGKIVILVDDGVATGSTVFAALEVMRSHQFKAIVVAVPIVQASTCEQLEEQVSKVVCLAKPQLLRAISFWYEDFSQTSDEEVQELLSKSRRELSAVSHLN
ncbi:phosphoribosyltransferase [Capilliphycus salinus ALCB114379]|uniref:phosphoribosyltransferase n=1 Tax=Capilliphycus salinus TaxID=2768948 RepID=UPI0039A6CF59